MAKYCEDWPCCGHTNTPDGDPCDPRAYGIKTSEEWANDPHLMCDHEQGICEVEEDDTDTDEQDDYDELNEDGTGYAFPPQVHQTLANANDDAAARLAVLRWNEY